TVTPASRPFATVGAELPADESLPVRHDVAYTWDYGTRRPELRQLYEKSKDLMWNARDLPWDTDVDPESELIPDAFNPIFGTDVWKGLDPKREIPKLRQHL